MNKYKKNIKKRFNMKRKFIFIIALVIFLFYTTASPSQTKVKSLNSLTPGLNALILTNTSDVNLNTICPGCQKSWSNDSYCIQWEVTTNIKNTVQNFKAEFTNPSDASTYNLDWQWQYQENNGGWKNFANPKVPMTTNGNRFQVESSSFQCITSVKFRVCVKGLQPPCSINSGTFNLGFVVSVSSV